MEVFQTTHQDQLEYLGIPNAFVPSIKEQLDNTFVQDDDVRIKEERLLQAGRSNVRQLRKFYSSEIGAILCIPYLCTWDMMDHKGLWNSLSQLSISTLKEVYAGLRSIWNDELSCDDDLDGKETLMNQICDPRIWSRIILYRKAGRVRAALPPPPFLIQMDVASASDDSEADLIGPFHFEYHPHPSKTSHVIDVGDTVQDCALAYVNPNRTFMGSETPPTIDLVPLYSVPNEDMRCIRYAALLGQEAPPFSIERTKEIYANFVCQMHLVRQKKEEEVSTVEIECDDDKVKGTICESQKLWRVYTDSNDPMGLAHPEAGLSNARFTLVEDPRDADIIYSYTSLFVEGSLRELWESHSEVLINQFPYEGAFLSKDHLGREILKQYGSPRPSWAIETYDLDVQLGEFVGAGLLEADRCGGDPPVWIVKPARGTQSQGHVVTRSLGQVLRLIDSGGGSRVAQRYIENPVCYQGRKIDCRCLIMMSSAKNGFPTLYLYNRFYFRIARKPHTVRLASDLMEHQSVLTAMHLVDRNEETNQFELPIDFKMISQLESDYGAEGFQWEALMLPKLKTMVRELFTGMTQAFPAMGEKCQYRALYGVDTMFAIEAGCVEPKLTEVSFCPANNAMCDAYERDDYDFRNFNTDVFDCLFMGKVPSSVTRIQ